MILAEVRDYLAQRGRAPLSDLCNRFAVDDATLRPMLEHWVRKGRLRWNRFKWTLFISNFFVSPSFIFRFVSCALPLR